MKVLITVSFTFALLANLIHPAFCVWSYLSEPFDWFFGNSPQLRQIIENDVDGLSNETKINPFNITRRSDEMARNLSYVEVNDGSITTAAVTYFNENGGESLGLTKSYEQTRIEADNDVKSTLPDGGSFSLTEYYEPTELYDEENITGSDLPHGESYEQTKLEDENPLQLDLPESSEEKPGKQMVSNENLNETVNTEASVIEDKHASDPPNSTINEKTNITGETIELEKDLPRFFEKHQESLSSTESAIVHHTPNNTTYISLSEVMGKFTTLAYEDTTEALSTTQSVIGSSTLVPTSSHISVINDDLWIGYFDVVRENDIKNCFSLMICEISAGPEQYQEYGHRVSSFFRHYQPREDNRAGWWYKNAATLGSESKSVKKCRNNFPFCRIDTKHLVMLMEVPRKT